MRTRRYIALLRGVNVGGSNIISMAALRACLVEMGFAGVATYIQSGNVIFSTPIADRQRLEHRIERALSARFGYTARVVVVSRNDLKRVVDEAPRGFGKEPARYRYDVIFLKPPLTPRAAMAAVEVRQGVDSVWPGSRALYSSRLIAKATQSRLSRIVQKPEYQSMTIRNWNTATRLLALARRNTQAD